MINQAEDPVDQLKNVNFDPKNTIISAVLWLAALVLSLLVNVGISIYLHKADQDRHWATLAGVAAIALIFLAVLIIHQVVQQASAANLIRKSILGLRKEVRRSSERVMSVKYISATKDRASVYREAEKLVRQAQDSVIVLTSYLLDSKPDDKDLLRVKRDYFGAILKQVRVRAEVNPRFEYRRVIQCRRRSDLEAFAKDGPYRDHILEMTDCRENENLPVYLTVAEHARPTTILIVDGRYIVWQINSVLAPGAEGAPDELAAEGMFKIVDPAQNIIQHHLRAFRDVEGKGVPLTEHELEMLRNEKLASAANSTTITDASSR